MDGRKEGLAPLANATVMLARATSRQYSSSFQVVVLVEMRVYIECCLLSATAAAEPKTNLRTFISTLFLSPFFSLSTRRCCCCCC